MRAWRKLIAHERRRQAPLEEKAHQRMYDTPPHPNATLTHRRARGLKPSWLCHGTPNHAGLTFR